MTTPYRERIVKLQKLVRRQGLDSLLVSSPVNWFYLTGFTGEAGMLLVEPRRATLLTDGRFTTQAAAEAPHVTVVLQKDGLYRTCGELLRQRRLRRVGFDSEQLTVAQLGALEKAAGTGVRFPGAPGLVESLRAVKSGGELAQMRKAALLASEVVQAAVALLKLGI